MSANDKVYVIAEAGVNHNGDIQRAHALIEAAAECGADAVKFQTFIPEALASRSADKAGYQQRNEPGEESQLAMLERLALSFDDHLALVEKCRALGIDFLSSPFDLASARFLLDESGLKRIKLGSGELTNAPLLWEIANSQMPMILSTGMATLEEVKLALGVCRLGRSGQRPRSAEDCVLAFDPQRPDPGITLMHCTTEYPCPVDHVNLRAMETLREATGLTVGYSDHTQGIAVSLAAVARGARIIEKHFTLNRALPGPDHAASLEVPELEAMISGVRTISQALGKPAKSPTDHEKQNADAARKSLVAARPIQKGEVFDASNLTTKRPGTGLAPVNYWSVLNTCAERDYNADDPIEP